MSRTRRIAVIALSLALTAGVSVAAAPSSNAGILVKATQGPIRCC